MSKKYTFREITEKDELEQAFRLRYNAYKDSCLKVFLNQNKNEIDISHFDLHSKILGIFLNDELVATNRLCVERSMLFNEKILGIGLKYGIFNETKQPGGFHYNGHEEYPFMSFRSISPLISKYLTYLKSANIKIAECGKFAIKNEYKSLRMMKFMFDSMFVFGLPLLGDQRNAVLTETFARHTSVYKSYGFKEHATFQFNPLDQEVSFLSLELDPVKLKVPEKNQSEFYRLSIELKTKGEICREF